MNLTLILPVTEMSPDVQSVLKSWSNFKQKTHQHLQQIELVIVTDGMLDRDFKRLKQWVNAQQDSEQTTHSSSNVSLLAHDRYLGSGFACQSVLQFLMRENRLLDTDWLIVFPQNGLLAEGPYNPNFDWIAGITAQLQDQQGKQSIEICGLDAYPLTAGLKTNQKSPAEQMIHKGIGVIQSWIKEQCGIDKSLPAQPDVIMMHRRVGEVLQREFGEEFLYRRGPISTMELYCKLNWISPRMGTFPWPLPGDKELRQEVHLSKLMGLWKNRKAFWSLTQWLQKRILTLPTMPLSVVNQKEIKGKKRYLWENQTPKPMVLPTQEHVPNLPNEMAETNPA
jgi:hypothetical protein